MTNDYLTDYQSITERLFIDFIDVIDQLRLDLRTADEIFRRVVFTTKGQLSQESHIYLTSRTNLPQLCGAL